MARILVKRRLLSDTMPEVKVSAPDGHLVRYLAHKQSSNGKFDASLENQSCLRRKKFSFRRLFSRSSRQLTGAVKLKDQDVRISARELAQIEGIDDLSSLSSRKRVKRKLRRGHDSAELAAPVVGPEAVENGQIMRAQKSDGSMHQQPEETATSRSRNKKKKQQEMSGLEFTQRPLFRLFHGPPLAFYRFSSFADAKGKLYFIKDFALFLGENEERANWPFLFLKTGSEEKRQRIYKALKLWYQTGKFDLKSDTKFLDKDRSRDPDFDFYLAALNYGDHSMYDLAAAFKLALANAPIPLWSKEIEKAVIQTWKDFQYSSLLSCKTLSKQLKELGSKYRKLLRNLGQPFANYFSFLILILRYTAVKQGTYDKDFETEFAYKVAIEFAPIVFRHSMPKEKGDRRKIQDLINILFFFIDSQCSLPTSLVSGKKKKADTDDEYVKISIKEHELEQEYDSLIHQWLGQRDVEADYVYRIKIGLYQGRELPLPRLLVDCVDYLKEYVSHDQDFFFGPAQTDDESEESETSLLPEQVLTKYDQYRISSRCRFRFFELGPAGVLEELDLVEPDNQVKVAEVLKYYLLQEQKMIPRVLYERQLKYILQNLREQQIDPRQALMAINIFFLDHVGCKKRAALCYLLDFFLRMLHHSDDSSQLLQKISTTFAPILIDFPKGDETEAISGLKKLILLYNKLKKLFLNKSDYAYAGWFDQYEIFTEDSDTDSLISASLDISL